MNVAGGHRPIEAIVRGAKTVREFRAVPGLAVIEVPAENLHAAMEALRSEPGVHYAEPDFTIHKATTPNDPLFDMQWGLRNTGQTVNDDGGLPGVDIGAVDGWKQWTGDPEFRIAVIDTGIDYLHPALVANIWTNPGEIPDNKIDDDGNGWIDDIHGYNTAADRPDPMDDDSHGTHVAGIIGATGDDGVGTVGVNWRCKLVALKFLDANGSGETSDAIEALQYVIDNDIKISNNSWGCNGCYSQALSDMIQATQSIGHVFIAAAGNGIEGVGVDTDEIPFYPGCYGLPNLINVAAINNNQLKAGFSNFGFNSVHIGAPGVTVLSTVPGGEYAYFNGTSMAAPHVAGVVGLVMSRYPDWTWQQVRGRVLGTAQVIPSLLGRTVTGGLVSVTASLGDCNGNDVADEEEILQGASQDCNTNLVPDECEADFDVDGTINGCDADIDGDGVFNASDLCPLSVPGIPVKPNGGPLGDANGDCSLQLNDFQNFVSCMIFGGPGESVTRICRTLHDFDADQDVDMADYRWFQNGFGQ